MKVMKPGERVRGRRVFLKESTKEIRQGRQVIKSCLVLKDRKEGIQAPTNDKIPGVGCSQVHNPQFGLFRY